MVRPQRPSLPVVFPDGLGSVWLQADVDLPPSLTRGCRRRLGSRSDSLRLTQTRSTQQSLFGAPSQRAAQPQQHLANKSLDGRGEEGVGRGTRLMTIRVPESIQLEPNKQYCHLSCCDDPANAINGTSNWSISNLKSTTRATSGNESFGQSRQ